MGFIHVELCGGVHTSQRQTSTQISIVFFVNIPVSVSVSVSLLGSVNATTFGPIILKKLIAVVNLFNKLDSILQVHSKVNELPVNAFLLILLLFQYKHVVVEELLQTFICVVDQQLFQGVQLKL